jgi:putative transposase
MFSSVIVDLRRRIVRARSPITAHAGYVHLDTRIAEHDELSVARETEFAFCDQAIDITYIKTEEGFLYLSFVLDAYSRRLVGWAMATHLRTELVLDALQMAIWRRKPAPGLIHHSDQGVQYTSLSFGKSLEEAGIVPSMGSVGSAYDNAMAESFIATLKTELLYCERWPTRESAKTAIFEYLEVFYNRRRLHSALGYKSPADYEEDRIRETTAA